MTRSIAVVVGGVAATEVGQRSSVAPGIPCTDSRSFNRVRGVKLWKRTSTGQVPMSEPLSVSKTSLRSAGCITSS
jgi:hypothetical protein